MGGTENVHPNLAKVPKCPAQDSAESWTDNLRQLPCFTFRTLYKHFAERTEFEVDDGECTDGAQADVESLVDDSDTAGGTPGNKMPPSARKFRSFRGLDKGYRFFRDGHVQKIRRSTTLACSGDAGKVCYVACNVLPSMRKHRIYNVCVCCTVPPHPDISVDVRTAYCICPAGLAGSCNHVAALLYALEDFVRNGL